jgi:hypothetical protein
MSSTLDAMMTLDENILGEARTARDRLLELQHEAERAQADFQHAVRRLHAVGGSMREIGESLSLSHQRVHQIVDAATPGSATERPGGPFGRARRGVRDAFARFTDDARQIVVNAQEEAASFGHDFVGTEHLLLAVLRSETPGVSALETTYDEGGRAVLESAAVRILAGDRAAGEEADVRVTAVISAHLGLHVLRPAEPTGVDNSFDARLAGLREIDLDARDRLMLGALDRCGQLVHGTYPNSFVSAAQVARGR